MVTRDTPWPAGTPCWIDLAVNDVDKASGFYERLFGWDIQAGSPEVGGYAICLKDGRAVAGISPLQDPGGTPSSWTTYLASDNADETVAKVQAAGGKVLLEPLDVMDVSRIAVAEDPAGAVFGIWQARAQIGIGLANEPGSLAWSDNSSPDFERSRAFYHSVFGYDYIHPSFDGFRLAIAGRGDGPVSIITEAEAGRRAQWSTVFRVEDPDKAVADTSHLDGQVIVPRFDTPYGSGAVLRDNQGAVFAVTAMSIGVCAHGYPTFDINGGCMSSPCPP
jgi:predicted enzyme related to lactoylglutathione lyase